MILKRLTHPGLWPMSWQQYTFIVKKTNPKMTVQELRECFLLEQAEHQHTIAAIHAALSSDESVGGTFDYNISEYCDDYVEYGYME